MKKLLTSMFCLQICVACMIWKDTSAVEQIRTVTDALVETIEIVGKTEERIRFQPFCFGSIH